MLVLGLRPSKTLIRPGDVLAAAARVPGVGEAVDWEIDVPAALARRDYMTSNWNDVGQEMWLADHEITLVRGSDGCGPGNGSWSWRPTAGSAGCARGGRSCWPPEPRRALPPVAGLAEARPWTNREITAAKEVPQRLVVLGGGAVGLEWRRRSAGSAARR